MKWTKILILALYTLIVVCIGLATVIEKYRGTAFVSDTIYGAWWFVALWAVLTVAALAYIVRQQLYKRMAVFLLHLSFVIILAGALTTHLFARRGIVRLRTGVPEMTYIDQEQRVHHLSFSILLKEFRIVNYPGTDAPLDYQSVIQLHDNEVVVSMNHIGTIDGYRLFQQSYDSDGEGVTLGLSYDPYGIAITYVGYLLLCRDDVLRLHHQSADVGVAQVALEARIAGGLLAFQNAQIAQHGRRGADGGNHLVFRIVFLQQITQPGELAQPA